MEPLSWSVVANLIIQLGLPAVIKLVERWTNGDPVTIANLQELLAMTEQRARDRMLLALKNANIDPTSPQGLALLAAVGP